MSEKQIKIFRRQASREARAKLGAEIELLREIFKPKPKWIPRWLWGLGLSIYIEKGEWEFKPWEDKPSKIPKGL